MHWGSFNGAKKVYDFVVIIRHRSPTGTKLSNKYFTRYTIKRQFTQYQFELKFYTTYLR